MLLHLHIDSCSYQLWASEGCGRPFKSQTYHKGKHATKVNRRSVSWRSRRFAFDLCLSNPNRWHRNHFLHEYRVRGFSATDLLYYSRILFFPCTSCLHDSCSEENFSILTLKRCIKYIKHHSFHALLAALQSGQGLGSTHNSVCNMLVTFHGHTHVVVLPFHKWWLRMASVSVIDWYWYC